MLERREVPGVGGLLQTIGEREASLTVRATTLRFAADRAGQVAEQSARGCRGIGVSRALGLMASGFPRVRSAGFRGRRGQVLRSSATLGAGR